VTEGESAHVADPGGGHSDLDVRYENGVRTITMTRPRQRNALSRALIGQLIDAFDAVRADGETRVVVLAAEGPAFCAGGDIGEYAEAAVTGQPGANAEALAHLLATISSCPVPVVARVHGAAYGGGVGLICTADIVVASTDASFSLSEARLGLVPAAIAPYVLQALGTRRAMAHMLGAAPFGVDEALACGLIHRSVSAEQLDATVGTVVINLLQCAPGALATIKRLPELLAAGDTSGAAIHAARVTSDEGREGIAAFLEKRPAAWVPPSLRHS
jgi:methylglutaconyl-CoA hydratase